MSTNRLAYMRALDEIAGLVNDGAPSDVIGAAKRLAEHVRNGTTPERWIGEILMRYAHKLQRVDRYGK